MSTYYAIRAIINAQFNAATIKKLIDRGTSIGYQYVDTKNECFLSTQETLTIVLQDIEASISQNGICGISGTCWFTYLDTYCFSSFSNKNDFLSVSINPCGGKWYTQPHTLDYDRYAKLLLNVCQDFEILQLSAYDDGYDEDFYYLGKDPSIAFDPNINFPNTYQQYITITPIEECNDLDYVTTLLNCGITAGWIFCTPVTLQSVSIETAAQALLENAMKNSFRELALATHLTASLWGKIDDRYYGIKIGSRPNTCHTISIIAIDHPDNPQAPYNFHHIIRDALDLCTTFGILEIATFDSRYNEYKIWNNEIEKMEKFNKTGGEAAY